MTRSRIHLFAKHAALCLERVGASSCLAWPAGVMGRKPVAYADKGRPIDSAIEIGIDPTGQGVVTFDITCGLILPDVETVASEFAMFELGEMAKFRPACWLGQTISFRNESFRKVELGEPANTLIEAKIADWAQNVGPADPLDVLRKHFEQFLSTGWSSGTSDGYQCIQLIIFRERYGLPDFSDEWVAAKAAEDSLFAVTRVRNFLDWRMKRDLGR